MPGVIPSVKKKEGTFFLSKINATLTIDFQEHDLAKIFS
jgi:hypothetical protein